MLIYQVIKLKFPKGLLGQPLLSTHTATCPTLHSKKEQQKPSICTPKSGKGPSDGAPPSSPGLKRALKSGKVRFGFLPEEWFLFFHSKTGVSGPYIFGIVFINYLFSKEIYVMEHEYYTSLSIFPMLYFASTRLGPAFAKFLDKDIDEIVNNLEKGRKEEMNVLENIIKDAKDAQWRAEGQKLLMDAKKEHIAMQLEAVYRERYMQVFRAVKGRLDYQVKLHQSLSRIQQKCMINWIIENVKKAITPEFEKKVFEKAIQDISAIAGRT